MTNIGRNEKGKECSDTFKSVINESTPIMLFIEHLDYVRYRMNLWVVNTQTITQEVENQGTTPIYYNEYRLSGNQIVSCLGVARSLFSHETVFWHRQPENKLDYYYVSLLVIK